jgi:hypothetical protein
MTNSTTDTFKVIQSVLKAIAAHSGNHGPDPATLTLYLDQADPSAWAHQNSNRFEAFVRHRLKSFYPDRNGTIELLNSLWETVKGQVCKDFKVNPAYMVRPKSLKMASTLVHITTSLGKRHPTLDKTVYEGYTEW